MICKSGSHKKIQIFSVYEFFKVFFPHFLICFFFITIISLQTIPEQCSNFQSSILAVLGFESPNVRNW